MAELKTKPTDESVTRFLDSIEKEQKRSDAYAILDMMREVTGEEPRLWGDSIVGFGSYHYKYRSGREGEWFLTGFSPRAQNLTLYIMSGFDAYNDLLAGLGKYKTGKSCLYVNKLTDIDPEILKQLVVESVASMKKTNPS